MLTLFSTAKPFKGLANIIQRNALHSWTLLEPRPEIILFDDTEGSREVAAEFGLRHIPEVERNSYGTPIVKSYFEIARTIAQHDLLCHVNADVILMRDLVQGALRASQLAPAGGFLLVGRRWNIPLAEPWDFGAADWEGRLRAYIKEHGWRESAAANEYFIYPKSIRWNLPPFAIGRSPLDGWILWEARKRGFPVIDASAVITIAHQQHGYSHVKSGGGGFRAHSEEAREGERLRGSFARQFNQYDATHLLTSEGLIPAPKIRRLLAWRLRARMATVHLLRVTLHPYSYPLVVALMGIRELTRVAIRGIKASVPRGTRGLAAPQGRRPPSAGQ